MGPFDLCSYTGNLSWLESSIIFMVKHGSHAYGLNTETSDLDVKGVAIPPNDYVYGMKRFDQAEYKDAAQNAEAVVYDVRKFCSLAADCNPNIIEVLWADPDSYFYMTPLGLRLVDNRELFISKKARFTFSGYMMSQIKRIETHRRWLLHPPKSRPSRADYQLPENWRFSDDDLGVYNKLQQDGVEFPLHISEILNREKRYQTALKEFSQYETWKRERNVKRAEFEAKFGYDVKHACHTIRLGRMCIEILRTGIVKVMRDDRDDLMSIRRGEWSYEKLLEEAKQLDELAGQEYEKSSLQHHADTKSIEQLQMELIEEFLHIRHI